MASGTRGIIKSVHSPDQAAFCGLMIGARKAAGLTQQALALRLKKPQSFVAKYEGGERRLDVVEFVAIARILGADPVKLIASFVTGGKARPAVPKKSARRVP
jgi:transcriptional regulator with XRE-family HTH domain